MIVKLYLKKELFATAVVFEPGPYAMETNVFYCFFLLFLIKKGRRSL